MAEASAPNGTHAMNGDTTQNGVAETNGTPSSWAAKHDLSPHFIGGNHLEVASPGRVKDFVHTHDGHTVITNVLIANNGIAAVKMIRSVRKWAYETFGNERAIQFTVMATPEDLQANADYIRMADQYTEVPGGTNNNNYANVELIVDVAERMNVHAVWAGWGHASENPKLPESLAASPKKIVFIGPPGSAMRSLGDKISSTIVAQHAGVSCIPWSGLGVDQVRVDDHGIVTVDPEIYDKGCTHSPEEGLEAAKKIGFPVMIKASEGGGGKGIRKVDSEDDFTAAYKAAASEIPGSPIFIMKLAGNARHLEVQLLADQYGQNISLFGRDCSVQRRHQKIIEEAPATIANPDTFQAMEKAAVSLGKLVGYVSAGTVEYLYSHADDQFYFLELNPRLQVEHPTTEMVTGVNLPAAQLQVAMGIPLHRIRDIRLLYGADVNLSGPIDFSFSSEGSKDLQRRPQPKGHTTACRITSEDPSEGFKPSGGTMHELNFRSSSNVWGYFSVGSSGGIHNFADSQFGHIFAYGENRAASRKHMVVALKELSIRGDFRTTVEYLIKLLETPAFEDNTITTGWLDELISKKLTAERPDPIIAVVCGAVSRAHIQSEGGLNEYRQSLEKGQVPSKDVLKTVFPIDFIYEGQRYKFTATRSSNDSYTLFINGSRCFVGVRALADGGLLVLLGGKSHNVYWKEEVGATRLSVDGKTCLLEEESDPTQLRAPSPGKLIKFSVENGEHIKKGQTFAEVEVMKMFMPIIAQEDGTVNLIKQPGATLEAGDILGILQLDDPSKVKSAQPFLGQLPDFGNPTVVGTKPPQRFALLKGTLQNILQGYDNQVIMQSSLKELVEVLRDPQLPYGEWSSQVSALHARMPQKLDSLFEQIVERAHARELDFPAKQLKKAFNKFLEENVEASDTSVLKDALASLTAIMEKFADGLKQHEYQVFIDLLEQYEKVESQFSSRTLRDEDIILSLRDTNKDDIATVVHTVLSHSRAASKNNLIISILDTYRPNKPGVGNVAKYFRPILRKLAELEGRPTAKVALKAREVLIQCAMPSLEERTSQMEHILRSSVIETRYGESGWDHRPPQLEALKDVVDSRYTVFDVLPFFFAHQDPYVSIAALEVYIRRAYRAYSLLDVHHHTDGDTPFILSWDFVLSGASEYGLPVNMSNPATPATPGTDNPFSKIHSISDMTYLAARTENDQTRKGAVIPVHYIDEVEDSLSRLLEVFPMTGGYIKRGSSVALMADLSRQRKPAVSRPVSSEDELSGVCNVAIRDAESLDDNDILNHVNPLIKDFKEELVARRIRRLTFVCGHKDGTYPGYFTFRGPGFEEDSSIRHIEPALAFQLELGRLSKFNIRPVFTENRGIHVYEAIGKGAENDKRYFTRAVVRPGRLREDIPTAEYMVSEADRLMNDILDALEIIGTNNSDMNHIFINFTLVFPLQPKDVEEALGGFLDRFGRRAWRLRVTGAEIRIVCTDPNTGEPYPLRVIITNTGGYIIEVELYEERKSDKGGEWLFHSIGGTKKVGSMHLRPVTTPYPTKGALQPKRYKAHIMGTQYVYDFPDLFKQAVENTWSQAVTAHPHLKDKQPGSGESIEYNELVLDEHDNLAEVSREAGTNTIGMVGWIVTARTPEYPRGRRFIIVANDITFKIGSFGPKEDKFFHKCSELARKLGIPRVYLSANSGARIGMAEELIPHFSVAWNDPSKPEKGFKYLYLTPEMKKRFEDGKRKEVITEETKEDGETRHKITTIIGAEDGLGVECLKGSGLIAGETSRAYDDIFTITLVTCRSVGIGAYLVRLGQRAVQVEGQPIILTGASAINKLLGREVYSSNLQLGGTQIMYKNGVSHMTANDDFEGVSKIVKWMSFVPDKKGNPLPISPSIDTWDRDVTYFPPQKQSYDVRWLIAGKDDDESGFLSGLFDKGSFEESLGGWARTVVTGRARLGGIPVGVIGVETRAVDNVTPADPANPDSTEQISSEAGGVWYPNSAYKTAQAIRDFNKGEQLPLMILANWRGFSGGQRDMFNEVLKYGSYIVDALVAYEQPIFVYIPPHGELRGGSWVVVDPTINSKYMEMYADEDSRGGVLEPDGIIGIKYRKERQLETMARLDDKYASLKRKSADTNLSREEQSEIKKQMEEREKNLLPIYHQIAYQFADLHDRAGRMKAKNTIRQPLRWINARRFFYWRLRRKLNEEYILKRMANASAKELQNRQADLEKLKLWSGVENFDNDDMSVALWYEEHRKDVQARVEGIKTEGVAYDIASLLRSNREGGLKGVQQVLSMLPTEEREKALAYLSKA